MSIKIRIPEPQNGRDALLMVLYFVLIGVGGYLSWQLLKTLGDNHILIWLILALGLTFGMPFLVVSFIQKALDDEL